MTQDPSGESRSSTTSPSITTPSQITSTAPCMRRSRSLMSRDVGWQEYRWVPTGFAAMLRHAIRSAPGHFCLAMRIRLIDAGEQQLRSRSSQTASRRRSRCGVDTTSKTIRPKVTSLEILCFGLSRPEHLSYTFVNFSDQNVEVRQFPAERNQVFS